MRFLAPALVLLAALLAQSVTVQSVTAQSVPAQADPAQADPACLAAPTQDCVFQMALDQALAAPNAGAMTTGIVVTALLQEAEGSDAWSATLDLLWPSVSAKDPDPSQARHDLAFALWAVESTGALFGVPPFDRAPQTSLRLRALKIDLFDPRLDPEKEANLRLYELGRNKDLAAIAAQIAAADRRARSERALSAASGLIGIGQIDAAFGLLRQVPDPGLASSISRVALMHVLRTEGPDAAQTLARRFADGADRAEALTTVALELAKAGRLGDALFIAHELLMRSERAMNSWASESLAETLARGGERYRALAELEVAGGSGGRSDAAVRIQVIADTVALDFDAALARLAQRGARFDRDFALDEAVEALYLSGQPGVEDFLARLSPEDLPRALGAVGRAQIAAGNLPAALATLARLDALPTGEIAHHNLRLELAPFLARKGRIVEAVAMADAARHPWTTAFVAAEMR